VARRAGARDRMEDPAAAIVQQAQRVGGDAVVSSAFGVRQVGFRGVQPLRNRDRSRFDGATRQSE
jgi:hypothetical protein